MDTSREESVRIVAGYFERLRPGLTRIASAVLEDAESVVAEAQATFQRMIPGMTYLDDTGSVMAASVFESNAFLALYLAARERGVGVHAFGRALLAERVEHPAPQLEQQADRPTREERFAAFMAGAEESQRNAKPGEFVFEALIGDRSEFDWGMNITSCAICHFYAQHDAKELAPYLCALDDVESDREGLGLRRTGSIAVGADRCDFRYRRGGEPRSLAAQYPGRIRIASQLC